MTEQYFVGIDPTLTYTAICIVNAITLSIVDVITVHTPRAKGMPDDATTLSRIKSILNAIELFLVKHKDKKINMVAIESPALRASGMLSQLSGVFYSILFYLDRLYGEENIVRLSPSTVKKIITDNGNAEKPQVMEALTSKYSIDTSGLKNYDESDAVAIAVSAIVIMDYMSNIQTYKLSKDQIKTINKYF